jgi:hypothetical protein
VLGRFLHPGEREVVAALEQRAKKGDTVAIGISREDVSYPYFGKNLDRQVVFIAIPDLKQLGKATWFVVGPVRPSNVAVNCLDCRPVVNSHGWHLFHREG